jgi:hypothetical protein
MALCPDVLGHTVVNWALGHVVGVSLLGEPVGGRSSAVALAGIYVTASARRSVSEV